MGIGWPVMDVRLMVMGIHWSMERGVRKQNANRAAPACSVPLRSMSMNCIARTAATQSVMPIPAASTSGSCRRHGKTPLISVAIATQPECAMHAQGAQSPES